MVNWYRRLKREDRETIDFIGVFFLPIILSLLFACGSARGQEIKQSVQSYVSHEVDTAYRTVVYAETGDLYHLVYIVNKDYYWVPSTQPPGDPHYKADIIVILADPNWHSNKYVGDTIGKILSGTYVQRGCFCDDPQWWIRKAIRMNENN